MTALALASIAFNRPHLVKEQIRLLRKYLDEDFTYSVVDNSTSDTKAAEIAAVCAEAGVPYHRVTFGEHVPALQWAWDEVVAKSGAPYGGLLDHDIFPVRPTHLVSLIEPAGFLGCGQRHGPTDRLYLWPGWAFFSFEWLNGRRVDWDGIRGDEKANDGDTGSAMWPLFAAEDWPLLYRVRHSYESIRRPDDYGLQSFGIEHMGDWVHLTNGSGWMAIPNPREREALTHEMLAAL